MQHKFKHWRRGRSENPTAHYEQQTITPCLQPIAAFLVSICIVSVNSGQCFQCKQNVRKSSTKKQAMENEFGFQSRPGYCGGRTRVYFAIISSWESWRKFCGRTLIYFEFAIRHCLNCIVLRFPVSIKVCRIWLL